MTLFKNKKHKAGQIITEYVMILSFVFVALATTKIKIDSTGNLDLSGKSGSKTIMDTMSDSFTTWMRDILIIISLPT